MVSSGDNYLAGPEFNASLAKGVPHCDTIALDMIGYDASAIGNHEFDFGPDVPADFVDGLTSGVQFITANLDFSGEPRLQDFVNQKVIAIRAIIEEAGEKAASSG